MGRRSFRVCTLDDSLFYVYFHAQKSSPACLSSSSPLRSQQNPLDPHDPSPGPPKGHLFPTYHAPSSLPSIQPSQPPPHTSAPIHTSLDQPHKRLPLARNNQHLSPHPHLSHDTAHSPAPMRPELLAPHRPQALQQQKWPCMPLAADHRGSLTGGLHLIASSMSAA
jgi:hypothetical protein